MKQSLSFVDAFRGSVGTNFNVTPYSLIETPISPVRLLLIYTFSGAVVAAALWACFGELDVYAVAPGRVQTAGRTKVVQPGSPGTVLEIFASNGQKVIAGQKLVRLDDTSAGADYAAYKSKEITLRAENARRKAAIVVAQRGGTFDPVDADWPSDVPEDVRKREKDTFIADLSRLRASILVTDAECAQHEAERGKFDLGIVAQKELLKVLEERVGMREQLATKGVTSRANVLDAAQVALSSKATLATLEGSLVEASAAVEALRAQRLSLISQFVASNQDKIIENARTLDDVEQRLVKASNEVQYLTVYAPVSGTIQGMTVTTVGQYVHAGDEIMRIVPDTGELEVEAYLLNADVGFVKIGQQAQVKIDAFPYARYGTIDATVKSIANDAISGAEAQQRQHDSSRPATGSLSATSAAEKTQDLVFQVTLRLSASTMKVDGADIPLGSGMTVTADIATERRRLIDYILSPLTEVGSTALKER